MKNYVEINKTIKPFNKSINIEGDKSLSIRWALIASQAEGTSRSRNILRSEDVLNTLNCLKKLGVKIKLTKNYCEIIGRGLNTFDYKKGRVLNAGNSGTFARLILGLLVHSHSVVKIIGDKSLSKRDFERVIKPLEKFGAKIKSRSGKLPVTIKGVNNPKPIKYYEKIGSAQIKSSILFAALNTKGKTFIKAKKSRNHSELFFKHLNLPIIIKKKDNYDLIEITGKKKIRSVNYSIPADISSSAFFIVLTVLSKNSKLTIKNVNINSSRTGILKILKIMGVKIQIMNERIYKGEKIANLFIQSTRSLKPIICPPKLNSASIDEFLLIFLCAARADGVSCFKNLSELNEKESPRLKWGSKILNEMGIRTQLKSDSIKIYGNPDLKRKKNIIIKKFLNDHRVFMTSVVAALTFDGNGTWKIFDKNSVKTSFPSFLQKIESIGAKFN